MTITPLQLTILTMSRFVENLVLLLELLVKLVQLIGQFKKKNIPGLDGFVHDDDVPAGDIDMD